MGALHRRFIRDETFKWIEHAHKEDTSEPYVDFLISKAESAVATFHVARPIRYLLVDEPITLGRVRISYLRKKMFDDVEEHYRGNFPDQLGRIDTFRADYQGKAVASIDVEAERDRAIQVGHQEIEKTLAFLRFYSPSAIIAEIPSCWNVIDKPTVVLSHFLLFSHGPFPEVIVGQEQYIGRKESGADPHWTISRRQIDEFNRLQIIHAHQLLLEDEPGPVDDLITNCVLLFNKSLLEPEPRDRLVFLLVCLETLLLRNSGEPIQNSVGHRLAFLFSDRTVQERKNILSLLKEVYQIRSAYIHHGERTDLRISLLSEFQRHVWVAVHHLLMNRAKYNSKDEFLNELDDRLLS